MIESVQKAEPFACNLSSQRKKLRMNMPRLGSKRVAAVLLIVGLTIVDAVFTLELLNCGAREVNPIMHYYLGHGPLAFFAVKYLLTCISLLIVLGLESVYGHKHRVPVKAFFIFEFAALALVVHWQIYLFFSR
jgi:hypothetical protein